MRRIYHPSYRLKRRNRLSLIRLKFRKFLIYWNNIIDITTGVGKDFFGGKKSLSQPNAALVEFSDAATKVGDGAERRWCFYASYSPKSVVTDMVIAQLRAYSDAGFSVVFITMSRTISEADMEKLKNACTHVLHRRSFGRDFGAWAHAARLLRKDMVGAQALLLTNDSNLGPITPLQPWIDQCMQREGIFGMTESLGGGSHLQSYFLLGHGERAVVAILEFLEALRPSHSKWLMIERGEIGFTKAMQKRQLFVGAIIGHEDFEVAIMEDQSLQAELKVLYPGIFPEDGINNIYQMDKFSQEVVIKNELLRQRYFIRSQLFNFPLNPSHQLNSVLLRHFKFPFVKTELVVKNPGMVPSAPDWRYYLTPDSPVTEAMIDDHLATLT